MNLKDLLAYGRGLEMSDKQAKGIGKHEKFSCQKPQFHQYRKERERPKTRNVTGVANTTLIKDDLLQP